MFSCVNVFVDFDAGRDPYIVIVDHRDGGSIEGNNTQDGEAPVVKSSDLLKKMNDSAHHLRFVLSTTRHTRISCKATIKNGEQNDHK